MPEFTQDQIYSMEVQVTEQDDGTFTVHISCTNEAMSEIDGEDFFDTYEEAEAHGRELIERAQNILDKALQPA